MKKVLGLDLGIGSIGWALIDAEGKESKPQILGMGSRIISISKGEDKFSSGGDVQTKNAERTLMRTARKLRARYKQRRRGLNKHLIKYGMQPSEDLMSLSQLGLWKLRAEAATPGHQIALGELGRLLLLINKKRGYKHSALNPEESKETAYVAAVNGRYRELRDKGMTIGQWFYAEMLRLHTGQGERACSSVRVKDEVYPRQAYIDEYNQIMRVQQAFYPDVLTDERIKFLRDKIIFYQRPLKSCKHLVSFCDFEKETAIINGQRIDLGPKVCPKSAPLAELCRLWEAVNNMRLLDHVGHEIEIDDKLREKLINHLQNKKELNRDNLRALIDYDKDFSCNMVKDKEGKSGSKRSIKGNETLIGLRTKLKKILGEIYADQPAKEAKKLVDAKLKELLRFDLKFRQVEVLGEGGELETLSVIDPCYQEEPLHKLWHILYSIEETKGVISAIRRQFGLQLTQEQALSLQSLGLRQRGYANKSAKFITKILPYLMQGQMYSEAASSIGQRHSNYLTKEENEARSLVPQIEMLKPHSLRQPLVERILNQMILLVNQIKREHPDLEEVHVELARELRSSKDERQRATQRIKNNELDTKRIHDTYDKDGEWTELMGHPLTKSQIQRLKLWEEAGCECIYCGHSINKEDLLSGAGVEVEHIIPKSVLYDDSMSNKTCSCRKCNKEKNNLTAFEYIQSLGPEKIEEFTARLDRLHKDHRLPFQKKLRLLLTQEAIPDDFIERHLRQTQYITSKAIELLRSGFRHVQPSEGGVTATLRHLWGYDNILKSLAYERYASLGKARREETSGKSEQEQEVHIDDWSKRLDHRHHAIDALVVACTQPSFIQRVNSASSGQVEWGYTKDKITKYPHPEWNDVSQAVAQILISHKSQVRAYSRGRNKTLTPWGGEHIQRGVLIPRAELFRQSIYGRRQINGKEETVYRRALTALKQGEVAKIIDPVIRQIVQQRVSEVSNFKQAFAEPLYSDRDKRHQIRSVRIKASPSENSLIPLRRNEEGKAIAFVQSNSNDHLALYRDGKGKLQADVISLYLANQRARYGLPACIRDPRAVRGQALQQEELPEYILNSLPDPSWTLIETLRINDMVLIGMEDHEIELALSAGRFDELSKHLYRVQKLSIQGFTFRYHLDTDVEDVDSGVGLIPRMYTLSLKTYRERNVRKVHIDQLGHITLPARTLR